MNHWNLTAYRRGIRTSLRNNAAAYGYSIVATGDFATLGHSLAPPLLQRSYICLSWDWRSPSPRNMSRNLTSTKAIANGEVP
ncbi:MAG: hypothetical protein WDZ59_08995 [Pirellulales bacterium]